MDSECCVHEGDVHGGQSCETHKRPSHFCFVSALKEITKGAGAYDRDPLTHAGNCIKDMKELAEAAIGAESTSR